MAEEFEVGMRETQAEFGGGCKMPEGRNPVIAGLFMDSAKASLRARLSARLRPVEDPDAFGGE
jgi:hypothetical protein